MPFEKGTNMDYQGEFFGLTQDAGYNWTPIGTVIDHINKEVGVIKEYALNGDILPIALDPTQPPMDPRFIKAWKEQAALHKISWNEKFGEISNLSTKKFTNYQVKAMVVPFLEIIEKLNGSGKVLYKENETAKKYDITLACDETIIPSDGNALYLGYKLSTRHDGGGCLNAEWWTIRKVCVNGNLWGECTTANGHPAKISIKHIGKEDVRAAQMTQYIGDVQYAHTTIKALVETAIQTKFQYERDRTRSLMEDYYGFAKKFSTSVADHYEQSKDNAGNWYGLVQSVTSTARTMYGTKHPGKELEIIGSIQDMFSNPGWFPPKQTALPIAS